MMILCSRNIYFYYIIIKVENIKHTTTTQTTTITTTNNNNVFTVTCNLFNPSLLNKIIKKYIYFSQTPKFETAVL